MADVERQHIAECLAAKHKKLKMLQTKVHA